MKVIYSIAKRRRTTVGNFGSVINKSYYAGASKYGKRVLVYSSLLTTVIIIILIIE